LAKKYRALLMGCLIIAILTLGACDRKMTADGKVTEYTHPDVGFVVQVPEDWQKVFEDNTSAYWLNSDGSLGLMVFCQLGGYSYYDDDGVGDILEKLMSNGVSDWKVLSRETEKSLPMGWRIMGQGTDKEGNVVITDGLITEPLDAVRFYVMAIAGPEQYQQNQDVIDKIFQDFDVVATTDEIYKQMMIEKKAIEDVKEQSK